MMMSIDISPLVRIWIVSSGEFLIAVSPLLGKLGPVCLIHLVKTDADF